MTFNGKHALITGSSRGIGRGIALKLAEKQAKVAVHYYQNEAAANDTLAKIRALGSDGFIVQADVSQPDDIRHLFRTVEAEFGSLDIFVSNARPEAPTFFYPTLEITEDQWDIAVDSQAKAFLICRPGSSATHGGRRPHVGHHLCHRQPHRQPAAMGGHGCSQRLPWNRWFATSQLAWPAAASPSTPSAPAGPKTAY